MEVPFAQALITSVKDTPYTKELTKKLVNSRKKLGGWLFFDILAKELVDLDTTGLFPPKDKSAVDSLIETIHEHDTVKKLNQACLTYYLFLDFPPEITMGEDLPQYYSDEIDFPTGYRELVKGFWCLDRLQFDESLVHLSHPLVTPTFHDKVVSAYLTATTSSSSQTDQKYNYVMAYLCANNPKLVSQDTITNYMTALCAVSLYSGLEFTRTVSPDIKLELLTAMVEFCLENNPKRNLWRLVNLPFTRDEERLMYTNVLAGFVSNAKSEQHKSLAKDVLLMRSLHTGNVSLASEVANLGNNGGNESVSWKDLSRGLQLYTA